MFIGIVLVIGVVYGFALQRERIFTSLLSIYVGIVLSSIWGDSLFGFFQGKNMLFNSMWIQANTTPTTVKIAIFVIIVAIVSARAPIGYMRSWSMVSPIETVAYSLLNITLFLATIFRYLPPETQARIASQSHYIGQVNNYYNLLLILPIILLVVVTARRGNNPPQPE